MTDREHRQSKKFWKNYKRESRRKQKALVKLSAQLGTPPCTPQMSPQVENEPAVQVQEGNNKLNKQADKQQKRNKKMTALQNKITMLEKQLQDEKRKSNKYKKKLQRVEKKEHLDSPRTKTGKLLRNFQCSTNKKKVRRTLTFHFALLNQLRENYKNRKPHIGSVSAGAIMKKYGFRREVMKKLGVFCGRVRPKAGSLSQNVGQSVRNFFERLDVSTMTSGKKNTLTRNKMKKQRRILMDTMTNLFKKFIAETNMRISFTTFTRLRPFWVRPPVQSDRETCLCKTCENTKLCAEALHKVGVISTTHLADIVRETVCSEASKKCMYSECETCKHKTFTVILGANRNDTVEWKQWNTLKQERTFKDGEKKKVSVCVKEQLSGTTEELVDKFQEQLHGKYKRHSFNVSNQNRHYDYIRSHLKSNECLIHIDFAENYVAKMNREIQSMHFGASKNQITLHTGVLFTSGSSDEAEVFTFCGVSDSLQHCPAAIWAHLEPVLDHLKRTHPSVTYVHFFSDGPTTQYRQKQNFSLFSTEILSHGFSGASWNFFAPGHGKGIPDGVGGALKNAADRRVNHGEDISDAKSFIHVLQGTKTKVYLYQTPDIMIQQTEAKLKDVQIRPVPGTMQIHQLEVVSPGCIKYRDVSCTCREQVCSDHSFRTFSVHASQKLSGKRQKLGKDTKEYADKSYKRSKGDPVPEDCSINTAYFFSECLNRLNQCKTFTELQQQCQYLNLDPIKCIQRHFTPENHYTIDSKAMELLPEDVPGESKVPVCVKADGDCLPACGSVFAYGHDNCTDEIRLRIVHELALNSDYYLNDGNLKDGDTKESLKKAFAMYSDEFIPGGPLTEEKIRQIFESEVMAVTRPKSFMGIWQMFGLASVLHSTIYSIYPAKGNPKVREHLHRAVKPWTEPGITTAFIMWSSTRTDMNNCHWVPNHFVPVIPIQQGPQVCSEDLNNEPEENGHNEPRADTPEETTADDFFLDVPSPEDCLGKHVVVEYDGKAYPGVVEEVDFDDLLVDCMHSVGGCKAANCFFWPKAFKDKCWYPHHKVLAVIPKPKKVAECDRHFQINTSLWEVVLRRMYCRK